MIHILPCMIFWHLFRKLTEEKEWLIPKRNRSEMNSIVQFGQSQMNCGEQLMDGTLRIMFLERCSIDIFLKICVIT